MPIPTPAENESNREFVQRCMDDPIMIEDYPNAIQRLAICFDLLDTNNN
jgi:hypothetical protein